LKWRLSYRKGYTNMEPSPDRLRFDPISPMDGES
jgi:hypothetical protein